MPSKTPEKMCERAEWQPPSAPSLSVPLTDLGNNPNGTKPRSTTPVQQARPIRPEKPRPQVTTVVMAAKPKPAHEVPYGILVDASGNAQGYVRAFQRKERKFDLYTPGLYSSTIRPGTNHPTLGEGATSSDPWPPQGL